MHSTNLDGERSPFSCIAHVGRCDHVDAASETKPVHGSDHRFRTTFNGGDGVLQESDVLKEGDRSICEGASGGAARETSLLRGASELFVPHLKTRGPESFP